MWRPESDPFRYRGPPFPAKIRFDAARFPAPGTAVRILCDTRKGMYKRIVLKLSGEVLAGPRGFGLDADKVATITDEIVDIHSLGVEVGVVVGGGNIFRGVAEQAKEMDRVSADNMGMLSTVINAIAMPRDERRLHEPGGRALHPPPRRAPS